MKSCGQCKQGFEVTDGDRAFYGQMNVPEPKLCPADVPFPENVVL